jgi:hypothetical protein
LADNTMSILAQLMGQQQALGALGPAYEKAQGRYATNYYDPYSQATSGAAGMQANALGLGGAEGNKAATEAFRAGPGYQFALDQGLQALNRNAASRGMLASGNNTQDILRFSQGLANQEYGNWLNRLGDFSRLGLGAAQGQTGRQSDLASLDTGYGNAQAGIYTNTANNISDIMGRNQQQRQSGLGSAIAGGLNLGGSLLGMAGGLGGVTGSLLGGTGALGGSLGRYFT